MQQKMDRTQVTQDLIVGDGVLIVGSVSAPAGVQVHGVLEGDLTAGQVMVGESGRVLGSLTADVADIYGEISKDVKVSDRLILRSTARFNGALQYRSIEVEAGAKLNGSLAILQETPPAPQASPSAGTAVVVTRDASEDGVTGGN